MTISKLDASNTSMIASSDEEKSTFLVSLEPMKDNDDGVVIGLEGMLTIENVLEIYQKIEVAIGQFTQISILMKNVLEIDLSMVQLFFYLQIISEESGNQISFEHEIDGADDLVSLSGLKLYPSID